MKESRRNKDPKKDEITVLGVVIPAEWDENGNALAVAVATYNEEEYLLSGQNLKGRELKGLLQQKVEIKGTLKRSKAGRGIIRVRTYQKLEANPSELRLVKMKPYGQ